MNTHGYQFIRQQKYEMTSIYDNLKPGDFQLLSASFQHIGLDWQKLIYGQMCVCEKPPREADHYQRHIVYEIRIKLNGSCGKFPVVSQKHCPVMSHANRASNHGTDSTDQFYNHNTHTDLTLGVYQMCFR